MRRVLSVITLLYCVFQDLECNFSHSSRLSGRAELDGQNGTRNGDEMSQHRKAPPVAQRKKLCCAGVASDSGSTAIPIICGSALALSQIGT